MYRVWYYPQFQASAGGLGCIPMNKGSVRTSFYPRCQPGQEANLFLKIKCSLLPFRTWPPSRVHAPLAMSDPPSLILHPQASKLCLLPSLVPFKMSLLCTNARENVAQRQIKYTSYCFITYEINKDSIECIQYIINRSTNCFWKIIPQNIQWSFNPFISPFRNLKGSPTYGCGGNEI